jgi:enoyl-CoA hydratase
MQDNKIVQCEVGDGMMIITINRPEKLNALNEDVLNELNEAIEAINKEDSIKGAIITGAGEKAFVAGADIAGFLKAPNESGKLLAQKGQAIFLSIEQSSKPIIAAINGYALGGGCELAMSCHFRIASENAKFGQPEINLGIIPGYGGTQRLPKIIGKGRAMEMIMTGKTIDSAEAFSIGLINHVCKQEELMSHTKSILKTIIEKSTIAIAQIIKSINASEGDEVSGYETEAICFGEAFKTVDMKEGVTAFLEKRKPTFNKYKAN